MFRKILLATLAALGLMSAAVPTQAFAHGYHHHSYYCPPGPSYCQPRPWCHRCFCCYADANAWMCSMRQCGYECYCQWQGPECVVYYR